MERLTEKILPEWGVHYKAKNGVSLAEFNNKLGQLEDIEEELGVDLLTLFKAMKQGIWTRGGYYGDCLLDAEPAYVKGEDLYFHKTTYTQRSTENDYKIYLMQPNVWCIHTLNYENEQYVTRLADYGKTWALTKEALE